MVAAGATDAAEAQCQGSPSDETWWEVIIAGGGISGLALALALTQQGMMRVRVFERDEALTSRSQGYSLTIQQAGREALSRLGRWQEAQALAVEGGGGQHLMRADGQPLLSFGSSPEPSEPRAKRGQRHNVFIPRQDLRGLLEKSLPPGTIQWGTTVQSYGAMEQGGCEVTLSSGAVLRCGVLVGCEGVASAVRAQKLGDPLHFLGVGTINGIADGPPHPRCAAGNLQILDGSSRMFLKPFAGGRTMWQLTFPSEQEAALQLRSAPLEQLKLTALEKTAKWAPEFQQLVLGTEEKTLRGGALFDRDPHLCAAHALDSFVALIGDSAHPMSPFKGQGANQALLDAVELADLLLNLRSAEGTLKLAAIPRALVQFHQQMADRVSRYVLGSRRNVEFLHTPSAVDMEQLAAFYGSKASASELQESPSLRRCAVWRS